MNSSRAPARPSEATLSRRRAFGHRRGGRLRTGDLGGAALPEAAVAAVPAAGAGSGSGSEGSAAAGGRRGSRAWRSGKWRGRGSWGLEF